MRTPLPSQFNYRTVMFNLSLATGCFPTEFKEAVVRPRLKKTGLDTSERKNYPVGRKRRSMIADKKLVRL